MISRAMVHGPSEVKTPTIVDFGTMIRGRWRRVCITEVSQDEAVPLLIREALKDMEVSVIFTNDVVMPGGNVPSGSSLAYAEEIIEDLERCGKTEAAKALKEIASHRLDIYIFEPKTFKFI